MEHQTPVNCHSRNMIPCTTENCQLRYIGESECSLYDRLSEHIGYIRTNKEAPGKHFNKEGHTLRDIRATVIEKVKSQEPIYRKKREAHHIRRFNTFFKGINSKPQRA